MAATQVNKDVPKKFNLKRLAKKRKHVGTGDGGAFSDKMLTSK